MRRTALLVTAIALVGGCSPEPTTFDAAAGGLQPAGGAALQQGLAAVRSATARFHRFDVAHDAGYTFLFMNTCMVDQSPSQLGGMGYHYVNTGLLDGHVEIANPEAVLYEPGPNGQLNLVALEYVIPKDAWHESTPPRLLGQDFTLNSFDLWALHVWVWKNNPSGIFASWNPTVSCANAAATTAMAAH